jgi:hypothetical protein
MELVPVPKYSCVRLSGFGRFSLCHHRERLQAGRHLGFCNLRRRRCRRLLDELPGYMPRFFMRKIRATQFGGAPDPRRILEFPRR